MARLSDFVPEIKSKYGEIQKINGFSNFFEFLSKAVDGQSPTKGPKFGVDRWTNAWIQQRIGYRRQLLLDLWSLYLTVAEVRGPIGVIRNEVFRRGFKWEPKFAKKCQKCGKEYEEIVTQCEEEGCGGEVRDPDEEQKEFFDALVDDANIFGQSLLELLGGFEDNLNWADDGFLYLRKKYIEDGDKIKSKVIEIRNLHPGMVDLDLNDKGLPNCNHYICYLHRDAAVESKEGNCPKCKEKGKEQKMVPAKWVYYHQGTEKMYLLDDEVLHLTKFTHSETFGVSPLITLYDKILALVGMDKTIYRYFFERKLPSGMLLVATDDPEGLRRERAAIEAKMKIDPDYMPMIAYSARQGSRGRVDYVKLFHTLLETDYLPIKNDIRDRISAIWGVSPIWMAALEESGGISTQSQQLIVTSRVVEADQKRLNDKVFPFLLDALGISEWTIVLEQPEEKAESTRMQFMQQRIMGAMQLQQMGFKVKLVPGIKKIADIDFEVEEAPEGQEQPGMGGEQGFGSEQEGYGQQPGMGGEMYQSANDPGVNLHAHGGIPPHPVGLPHDNLSRKVPQEEGNWKEPEDEE